MVSSCSGEFHDLIAPFSSCPKLLSKLYILMLNETPNPFCKPCVVVSCHPPAGMEHVSPRSFSQLATSSWGLRGRGTQGVCGWAVLPRCSLFSSSSLPKPDVRTSTAQPALRVGSTPGREGHPLQKDGVGGKGTSLPCELKPSLPGLWASCLHCSAATTENWECGERCLVAFGSGKEV
ncbi:unnamed protein product [Rangifer tarandus platyrhynchus]|uniref:Uncharacterized protein n=2 Tax=Rangifer tarandus platyrhynchus TaxID=3082113 RepID=A0AC59Z970_RANTA|nr:unnamed protein product [Rangifer tarandus platyrhynchus]